ncbi:transposase [Nitratireductor aquimarinus]|uniref:integrase core domain-containing protein n=1 Tax=Nitratireductor aquimarinus TaxID=889300 RepID=UPI001A8E2E96|nr:transposase [Nitratireductor aquimarinus]MBY6133990.1 integrase core domain-containing protein [Nitratireductor aquimarinus]
MSPDQEAQITGAAWIITLTEAGARISMDGRGRCVDSILIERLWRSLKQEAEYLEDLIYGFKVHRVIRDWTKFYKTERSHPILQHKTPKEAYLAYQSLKLAA